MSARFGFARQHSAPLGTTHEINKRGRPLSHQAPARRHRTWTGLRRRGAALLKEKAEGACNWFPPPPSSLLSCTVFFQCLACTTRHLLGGWQPRPEGRNQPGWTDKRRDKLALIWPVLSSRCTDG